MSFSPTLCFLVFLSIEWSKAQCLTKSHSFGEISTTAAKHLHKRQLVSDLCYIPEPLVDGWWQAHLRRCPTGDSSAACRLDPGTPVNTGWVLRYSCDLGYQSSSSRIASICLRKPNASSAQWLPGLPSCTEASYTSRFLPPREVCGKPASYLRNKRGVNGEISKRGAWPWVVILGHNKTQNVNDGIHWFCAGTLVTRRHILTAANCVTAHRSRPRFLARLGDLHLDANVKDGAHPIDVEVDSRSIIVHPGFNPNSVFLNNIAVVLLKNNLKVTDDIKPVCLPTPDFYKRSFSGAPAVVVTWGQTDLDHELNPKRKRRNEPVLQQMKAKIIDNNTCSINYTDYQSYEMPLFINDKHLCATVAGNKNCQGDIGSPLMASYKGTFYLLGIVATNYQCFDEQHPRVFTNVAMFMDWILPNLKF